MDGTVKFIGSTSFVDVFGLAFGSPGTAEFATTLFNKWYSYMWSSTADMDGMRQSITTVKRQVKKLKQMMKYAPPPVVGEKYIEAKADFEQNKSQLTQL